MAAAMTDMAGGVYPVLSVSFLPAAVVGTHWMAKAEAALDEAQRNANAALSHYEHRTRDAALPNAILLPGQ